MWFFQNVKKHYEKKMFYIFGKKNRKEKQKLKEKIKKFFFQKINKKKLKKKLRNDRKKPFLKK